jgi:hypothetical protein
VAVGCGVGVTVGLDVLSASFNVSCTEVAPAIEELNATAWHIFLAFQPKHFRDAKQLRHTASSKPFVAPALAKGTHFMADLTPQP